MNTKVCIYTSLASLFLGILCYCIMQEIIIIRYPTTTITVYEQPQTHKKEVTLIFFKQHAWHHEKQEMLWHKQTYKNVYYLLNALLTVLEQEHCMSKKVSIETVIPTQSHHELYLSFDRNPFDKQSTTFEKWMFVESLLKTIRSNNISIQQIHFLVRQQPLTDPHLDFSKAWPIAGFLS